MGGENKNNKKMKRKIIWQSENKHVIIAERQSFYDDGNMIYVVYQERRYCKFDSDLFYELRWTMERWENKLEDAIKYAESLNDSFYVVNTTIL